MSRELTDIEINLLFEFCQKHCVPYYDLQVELVDHLASGIEKQWMETPEISFEQALNDEFGKFGVLGFSKLKKQREKALIPI